MKVVFYLDNKKVDNIDFSKPQLGNPGVGGTLFLFMTLPYYLRKYSLENNLDKYKFYLLTNCVDRLHPSIEAFSVSNHTEAIKKAKEIGADLFIFRPIEEDLPNKRETDYGHSNLNLIGWSHNNCSRALLRCYYRMNNYKAHVCVAREQLDALLDKSIYEKATAIFNGFESTLAEQILFEERDKNLVVYIGSLVPAKGFHMLAEVWKDVLKVNPNAKLKVIGNGRVYNRGAKLGKWNIAQEDYEERFMPFLLDTDGKLLDSVEFLGLMGNEKFAIMKKARVGVVNPTAMTEMCPGSALEFQACGVPVISGAMGGLFDTVQHNNTGILVRNKKALTRALIDLLEKDGLNRQYGLNASKFVSEKFDYNKVCSEWISLFENAYNDQNINLVRPRVKCNIFKDKKYIRLLIRKVFPFLIK